MNENVRRQPPLVIDKTPVLPDLTMVTVNTEFGRICVSHHLLQLWNCYGWPTDAVLKEMAEVQPRPVSSEETSVPPCQSPTCGMNLSACICGTPFGEETSG